MQTVLVIPNIIVQQKKYVANACQSMRINKQITSTVLNSLKSKEKSHRDDLFTVLKKKKKSKTPK